MIWTILHALLVIYLTGVTIAILMTKNNHLKWEDFVFGAVWPYIAFKIWTRR